MRGKLPVRVRVPGREGGDHRWLPVRGRDLSLGDRLHLHSKLPDRDGVRRWGLPAWRSMPGDLLRRPEPRLWLRGSVSDVSARRRAAEHAERPERRLGDTCAIPGRPLTTGTASATDPGGVFCTGQLNAGCFGSGTCVTITENGAAAGTVLTNVPANATLASVFCVPATGNLVVDTGFDLPGPGATALPGTFEAHN